MPPPLSNDEVSWLSRSPLQNLKRMEGRAIRISSGLAGGARGAVAPGGAARGRWDADALIWQTTRTKHPDFLYFTRGNSFLRHFPSQ